MAVERPIYREPRPITHEEAEVALQSGDPSIVNPAFFDLAFNDDDWRWVQEQCIRLSVHPVWNIRAAAATALGHLARIHRQLDVDRVLPILQRLKQESSEAASSAHHALSDVLQFVPGAKEVAAHMPEAGRPDTT